MPKRLSSYQVYLPSIFRKQSYVHSSTVDIIAACAARYGSEVLCFSALLLVRYHEISDGLWMNIPLFQGRSDPLCFQAGDCDYALSVCSTLDFVAGEVRCFAIRLVSAQLLGLNLAQG